MIENMYYHQAHNLQPKAYRLQPTAYSPLLKASFVCPHRSLQSRIFQVLSCHLLPAPILFCILLNHSYF